MRNLTLLLILGVSLFTLNLNAQYTLTLRLHDMDLYIGHRFEVRVTEQPSGKEVGRKAIESLQSDTASLLLYVFLQGRNYRVDFYADVNGNDRYNAPPADHAWRRTVSNTTANVTIDFTPDANYTDIGFPDAFPYSQYHADWGGKWMNQTFGSTDSITAGFDLRCDSIFGFFTTKGVFGNPAPVTFNYAGAVPSDTAASDTIRYTVPAPWTGDIIVVHGDIIGNIAQAGFGLVFQGTLGEKQILCLYTVIFNGNPLANGYFYVRELDIISSAPPFELSYIQIDATCAGVCDGYIDLMPSGGTPPYEFIWSNGLTTEDFPNACAGPGDVTVLDASGCSAEISFELNEPEPVYLNVLPTDPCPGLCNGIITTTAYGGTPPYQLPGGGMVSGLCPGEYFLWVTDAFGCADTDSVVLAEQPPIQLELVPTQPSCHGVCDGEIDIMVNGPIVDLTFTWIMGPPPGCPGEYILQATNPYGCSDTASTILIDPPAILFGNLIVVQPGNGVDNGSITVLASGGFPPFTYSLNGGAYQSSNVFTGLPAGTFVVCVKDASGCEICQEVILEEMVAVQDLDHAFNLYPNPVRNELHIESDILIAVSIMDLHGKLMQVEDSKTDHRFFMTDYPKGMYIVRISDGIRSSYKKIIRN